MPIPKSVVNHPAVERVVVEDGTTGKWTVFLKAQWKFTAGRAEDCTACSFDTAAEFKAAMPEPYIGRLTR